MFVVLSEVFLHLLNGFRWSIFKWANSYCPWMRTKYSFITNINTWTSGLKSCYCLGILFFSAHISMLTAQHVKCIHCYQHMWNLSSWVLVCSFGFINREDCRAGVSFQHKIYVHEIVLTGLLMSDTMKWSHESVKWSSQMSVNKSNIWRKMMPCLIYASTSLENTAGDFELFSFGLVREGLWLRRQLLWSMK